MKLLQGIHSRAEKSVLFALFVFTFLIQSGYSFAFNRSDNPLSLRDMIAQKLLIDLRYFCAPEAANDSLNQPAATPRKTLCQTPLTHLPNSLSDMLAQTKVGGVILFSENLDYGEQILTLTHDLQQSLLQGSYSEKTDMLPLYIAVDQEGGRVSRLPSNEFLGFAGNMAIGATYKKHGVMFAQDVATSMAKSLYALGFNLNFAPSLDVNSNPNNPIINVRSYSQYPEWVAQLGGAQIQAFQSEGIAAAAKHFPGHGDTHVDSHVGLPRVEHGRAQIDALDLMPFKHAIDHADVDMIMTAHIQYPALDNTRFKSKDGLRTELPATLSNKILKDILRDELNYKGLIVTDALDMAAISQFLTPLQATIKAFKAGADIALMPFKISSVADANAFIAFLDELTQQIAEDPMLIKQVEASYARIASHKRKRNMLKHAQMTLSAKQDALKNTVQQEQNKTLALLLSSNAMTAIKPLKQALESEQSIYALMPDKRRCEALLHYLIKASFSNIQCTSLLSEPINANTEAEIIIVGDVSPALSFYESRKFEGILASERQNLTEQLKAVQTLLATSKAEQTVLLKLRSPYVNAAELVAFDGIYASYDYQVSSENDTLFAPVFDSFTKILTGKSKALGTPPVNLQH
jgi:beta-N-acetylhexosaminidase